MGNGRRDLPDFGVPFLRSRSRRSWADARCLHRVGNHGPDGVALGRGLKRGGEAGGALSAVRE